MSVATVVGADSDIICDGGGDSVDGGDGAGHGGCDAGDGDGVNGSGDGGDTVGRWWCC